MTKTQVPQKVCQRTSSIPQVRSITLSTRHTFKVSLFSFYRFPLWPYIADCLDHITEPKLIKPAFIILFQAEICPRVEGEAIQSCLWASAVNVRDKYIYVTQPKWNRIMILDIQTQKVIQVTSQGQLNAFGWGTKRFHTAKNLASSQRRF